MLSVRVLARQPRVIGRPSMTSIRAASGASQQRPRQGSCTAPQGRKARQGEPRTFKNRNSFPPALVRQGSANWENHFAILSWTNLDERSARRFGILDTVVVAGSEQVRLTAFAAACCAPFFSDPISNTSPRARPIARKAGFAPFGARG